MVWRLTVLGIPRTKKNHRAATRGGRAILPSKQWQRWLRTSVIIRHEGSIRPIAEPVNCAALFYRDRNVGDAVGFYQGLADLLEANGVVTDDKWLVSWDGSRLLKDKERPRVEVTLTGVGA